MFAESPRKKQGREIEEVMGGGGENGQVRALT